MPDIRTISRAQARSFLVGHLGLRQPFTGGIEALLHKRRCIQLDPLDRVGNSADLFVAARIDGTRRGDAYTALASGRSFEHLFKVRCLLPPRYLPHYRHELRRTGWFSYRSMCGDPAPAALADVLAEFRERGPLPARELTDRGMQGRNYDHPWARKTTVNMVCVDKLEAACELVVVARTSRGKRYDLADRVFPEFAASQPDCSWAEFTVRERAEAAGLLPCNAGPWWALAKHVRTNKDAALQCELVQLEGLKRRYLAPSGFLDRRFAEDDGRMRVLGPLDQLLWDRDLVRHLWDFDYVWEVYKPKAKRRWGYYVCPLLHHGELVGRFEAHRDGADIVVDNVWPERGFDKAAFDACIERLAAAQ